MAERRYPHRLEETLIFYHIDLIANAPTPAIRMARIAWLSQQLYNALTGTFARLDIDSVICSFNPLLLSLETPFMVRLTTNPFFNGSAFRALGTFIVDARHLGDGLSCLTLPYHHDLFRPFPWLFCFTNESRRVIHMQPWAV